MDADVVCKVIDSLIGGIEPHGESRADETTLKNIKIWNSVIRHMIGCLYEVGINYNSQRYMHSVNLICAEADKGMEEVQMLANDYFNE